MGGENFADLIAEVKETQSIVARADTERDRILKQVKADVDRLALRVARPGQDGAPSLVDEHKSARDYLQLRHMLKNGSSAQPIDFGYQEIDQAALARKAFVSYVRTGGEYGRMIEMEKKALSEFSVGSIGHLVPPEISDRILSRLTNPGDLTGTVDNLTISSGAVQFLVDDVDGEGLFGWACEADCAANGNAADFTKGLGQLELRPEELRGLICASRSFLEDAAINIESWLVTKGQQGVRRIASRAIAVGTGVGMPIGILNPAAGIPICDTGAGTPAGQIGWQDLLGLMFSVPIEYHANGSWIMNQRTLGQLFGLSDANSRPVLIQDLQNPLRWLLFGHPVTISNFWPDVAPGATPVAFGDWKAAYLLVNRRALTMVPDLYTGWCVLFRMFARLGGGIICANAARLLRTT